MAAIASIKQRVIRSGESLIHEIEVRLWDKVQPLTIAGRHVGVEGFGNRVELTGKNGNAIELHRRVHDMTDDELKTRVAELIAKL